MNGTGCAIADAAQAIHIIEIITKMDISRRIRSYTTIK